MWGNEAFDQSLNLTPQDSDEVCPTGFLFSWCTVLECSVTPTLAASNQVQFFHKKCSFWVWELYPMVTFSANLFLAAACSGYLISITWSDQFQSVTVSSTPDPYLGLTWLTRFLSCSEFGIPETGFIQTLHFQKVFIIGVCHYSWCTRMKQASLATCTGLDRSFQVSHLKFLLNKVREG